MRMTGWLKGTGALRLSAGQLASGISALALLTGAAPGWGQGAAAEEATESEAIVVTGSRLRLTSGMETPVPVTAVAAAELKAMAPTTLAEGLSQLPQFYGNGTQAGNNFFGSGSTGSLNLRGLGANRTLVLLNGRRMISATAFGGVDVTNFPEALISSIETVTGGASAAYGTDAVAGVTNFILDTNFTGLRVSGQAGQTTRDDGANYQISATFGLRLGDRGHLILSAERFEQQGIHSYSGRDWYRAWATVPDANNVLQIYPNVVSRNASFDGIISAPANSPLYGLRFNADGSVSPFQSSAIASGNIGAGGTARQSIAGGGSGDDLGGGEVFTLQPDFDRSSLFAYADYELADGLTLFAQHIRGRKATSGYNQPRGSLAGSPTAVTIYRDNAFLPQSLVDLMTANNIASFTFRRMGSIEDLAGNYKISDETLLNSATAGFDWTIGNGGGFLDGWNVGGYYQYGHSKRTAYQIGLRVDRIFAAVDAVRDSNGNIVCRTTLFSAQYAGCQPLNLFGRGNASPAAVDWVIGFEPGQTITTPLFFANGGFSSGETDSYVTQEAKLNITTMRQHIAELSIGGEVHRGLGAGPIVAALGGSYREETIKQIVRDPTNPSSDHTLGPGRTAFPVLCANDPAAIAAGLRGLPAAADCANTVGMQFSKVSNIAGSIAVKEAFAEILVPLLAETPFFEQLSVNLSGRWAEYSGSGTVWAYKGGVDWSVTDGVRLRGTYSRDVRAANLSERFDVTGGTAVVNDPAFNNQSVTVTRFSGGNPGVSPELADTITAGAIFQPGFIDGLSISLDWYRIRIKDAIGQVGNQAVVNRCFAGEQDFCSLVTRDPSTNQLLLVGDIFVNINQSNVEGVDLEASLRRPVKLLGGEESIALRAFASWLIERSEIGSSGTKTDRAGQTGIQQTDGIAYSFPDFKLTSQATYRNGGVSAFVQGRYIAPGTQENNPGTTLIGHNRVAAVFYVDMRLGYQFRFANDRTLELFANVTNLLDRDPPIAPYWQAFQNNAIQTNGALFDTIGRRIVVGAKLSL
jgi:outer membrane receptor protein involved in Fe transport